MEHIHVEIGKLGSNVTYSRNSTASEKDDVYSFANGSTNEAKRSSTAINSGLAVMSKKVR